MSVPSNAVAAIHKNAALGPSFSATNPDSVVLIEAPMPDAVPTMPCAKLKRPVLPVRSAMIRAVRTPSAVALMPSSAWEARRSNGSLMSAKPSARIGKAANPISRSGRRPQPCACRPTHGAITATMICGTMISADIASEECACDLRTRISPASGSTEALASWNRNRLAAKMTSLESFRRSLRPALGGCSIPW